MQAELPGQIQAQLDEAARIQAAMAQPVEQPAPDPAEPTANLAPEPQEPAPAPQPAEPAKDAAYWEHRFKTLDGIHRADKARSEEALRNQGLQLQQLAQQVQAVTQQPVAQAKPEEPLVTTKDEDKFGSDLIDVARRVSREEYRGIDKRMQQIEAFIRSAGPQVDRVKRVEAEVQQTREDRFWSELATAVPEWEAINADPRWLTWLTEYDAVAGCTRQQGLELAQQKLDHRRAAAMFKLFKASITAPQATQQTRSQAELSRQVAPARTSTVTVQPQAPRTYTGAEYVYWLDPRRAYDTEKPRLTEMKTEIERAFAEGRIQF